MSSPQDTPGAHAHNAHSDSMQDLRAHLFSALRQVRAGQLDLDKARMVNELGKTLIDSARVEVDHLRLNGGGESRFLGSADDDTGALPVGITGRTVHRIKG